MLHSHIFRALVSKELFPQLEPLIPAVVSRKGGRRKRTISDEVAYPLREVTRHASGPAQVGGSDHLCTLR